MNSTNVSNSYDDFVITVHYGIFTPISWGVWRHIYDRYERIYSGYYDPKTNHNICKSNEEYVTDIFKRLNQLPNISSKCRFTLIIEPQYASFKEALIKRFDKQNIKMRIINYEEPKYKYDSFDMIYSIREAYVNDLIELSDLYLRSLTYDPDEVLKEMYMLITTPLIELKWKEDDNNLNVKGDTMNFLITLSDKLDTVYYVKSDNAKNAVVKLAEYKGLNIKYANDVKDYIALEDLIDLYSHYGFYIVSIVKASDLTIEFETLDMNYVVIE